MPDSTPARGARAGATAAPIPKIIATATPAPAAAPTPAGTNGEPYAACAAPSATQVAEDELVVARLTSAGVPASIVRACAAFSVLAQDGTSEAELADYLDGMSLAHARLVANVGRTPARRPRALVFADPQSRCMARQVLTGSECGHADIVARTSPAYAAGGDLWIVAAAHPSRGLRRGMIAHEATHVHLRDLVAGFPVPPWINEGLATYYEAEILASDAPSEALRVVTEKRRVLLDSVVHGRPRQPFSVVSLTDKDWVANYADAEKHHLQYAQAWGLVRWLIEHKGVLAVWSFLAELGRTPYASLPPPAIAVPPGASRQQVQELTAAAYAQRAAAYFAGQFQEAFGLTVDEMETQARAAWELEGQRAPDPLVVKIRLAPGGVRSNTSIYVGTRVSGVARGAFTPPGAASAGEYTLVISGDGTISETGGRLHLIPYQPEDLSRDVAVVGILNPAYRGANGTAPAGTAQVAVNLVYGQWVPSAYGRVFLPKDAPPEFLPGPLSAAFPDGNAVIVVAPSPASRAAGID